MSINRTVPVTDVYEFTAILGQGGYSYVVKGNHNKTHIDYAVKLFDKKKLSKAEHVRLRREIDINFAISHPNIVKVHEVYESDNEVSMVMDCMTGGELFDHIVNETGPLPEEQVRQLSKTILEIVLYLHDQGIVHRDLKPENLLFDSKEPNATLKLIDFGFAKRVVGKAVFETPIGTPNYVADFETPSQPPPAPEVTAASDPYTMEVDLWSTGCIIYFMLFARPPFYSNNEKEIEKLVASGKYSFPEKTPVSEDVKDLIGRLLERDPKKRLTAREALKHHWFTVHSPEQPETTRRLNLSNDEVKELRQSMNRAIDTQRRESHGPLPETGAGGVNLTDVTSTALWKKRNQTKTESREPVPHSQ